MHAKILKPTLKNRELISTQLKKGGIIGIPTETVYGLAANAFDEKALLKIFKVKKRPLFDPLIVHVSSRKFNKKSNFLVCLAEMNLIDIERISKMAALRLRALMKNFWPGPMTLVMPKSHFVPDLVTGGLDTVGIRMPRHPIAQKLLCEVPFPLAAPSANRFGRISPTSAQDVYQELGRRIPFILDGGRCEVGVESTVLYITPRGDLILLRAGGVSVREIELKLKVKVRKNNGIKNLHSPGMLKSHYSPRKPLQILRKPILKLKTFGWGRIGILAFQGNADKISSHIGRSACIKVLSPKGNVEEMARNFFSYLRYLDAQKIDLILSEPCPRKTGLYHAIGERLQKASQR